MDVQKLLADKIGRLPPGVYLDGLKAVRLHIESAVRHLLRGQRESDESAFTDTIYRCNQAFEGSVKEAYRVLSGKNPEKKTPAEIENYLIDGNVLRKKVLDQFTNYRTEWRNPSTHNYMLDFDEDEALLAIVSVTVFSIVLCDQIDTKIAYTMAEADKAKVDKSTFINGPLIQYLSDKVLNFAQSYINVPANKPERRSSHSHFEGLLGGYLAAQFANIEGIQVEHEVINSGKSIDLLVTYKEEKIAIEVKLTGGSNSSELAAEKGKLQASSLIILPELTGCIVYIHSMDAQEYNIGRVSVGDKPLHIIQPKLSIQKKLN